MWFGKNIIAKLGLVLALAVPSFAADVKDMYPLKFGTLNDELQAQYWNDLMSFKMWGTEKITFEKATLTDKVGALGTTGDFVWEGAGFELGGPIYVNGDVVIKDGQKFFSSGPARVNGDFKLDGDKEQNTLVGTYCIKGQVNSLTERACARGNEIDDTTHCELLVGESNYNSGACAKVKPIPENLFIPDYPFSSPGDVKNLGALTVPQHNTKVIDVPEIQYEADGVTIKKKMYDFVLSSLTLEQESKLFVRIGSPKSLARFFVDGEISLTSSSPIQVILVKDGTWNGSKWVGGTEEYVTRDKYAGNLLFYTTRDLNMPSMNGESAMMEGTFMSKGTISIGSNLYLAGQFLANEIKVSNDFNGEGFKFVPFNASTVRTASGLGNVIVEGAEDSVKIVLDKESGNDITFDYCFSFSNVEDSGTDFANAKDVSYALVGGSKVPVPLYDPATKKCKTSLQSGFKDGTTTLETPIILFAKNDSLLEHEFESFQIWIMNLEGAVLETGEHDGPITLRIRDIDSQPLGKDHVVAGTEDVPYKFDAFKVTNAAGSADITDYFVKVESLPAAGSLVLIDDKGKSVPVKVNDKISSADITAGNFVLKFDPDDYTEGPTPDPSKDIERYNFEFRVVDARNNAESKSPYKVLVTVDPVNDPPVASKKVFTIPEKSVSTTLLKTYATSEASDEAFDAEDVDDPKDVLTYKFDDNFGTGYTEENYNHVTSLYGIEENSGKIYVKEGATLDYESDDRELTIRVVITDKSSSTGKDEDIKSTSVEAVIKITDDNEPPAVKDLDVTLDEVTPTTPIKKDSVIGKVDAVDPDIYSNGLLDYLEYYLDPNADVPFAVNKLTGEVSVTNPAKLDYEDATIVDHKFVFDVTVKNCVLDASKKKTDVCLEAVSTVTIKLNPVNEPPIVIDTTGDTIKVAENSKIGLAMAYFEVTDPDADDLADLLNQIVPTITDNNKKTGKKSAEDLFEMVMEKTKDASGVDKYWAVLKVKAALDFEAIMAAHGDSVFDVTLTFTDQAGAGLDTTIAKKIAVTDVNEEPYFTDVGPFDVKENSEVGTFVGEVKAADDDIKPKFNTLYYTIPVNEDDDPANDVPFAIVDKTSGKITVANKEALDFEDPSILDHKFEFEVQVTDGEFPITTPVTITLSDDDEPPHIIPECEGDKCVEICKGDKCEVCEGESCHEVCIKNCDNPRDPVKVLTVTVNENSLTGFEIINYAVSDEDLLGNHTKDLEVTFDNTNNSGAKDLFVAEMKQVSGKWRLVISVKDGSLLDYEKIKETHELTIYVRDPEDREGMRDSLLRVIKVVDVNEEPYFVKTGPYDVKENSPVGTLVGEVVADDYDINPEFRKLVYTIPVNEDDNPDNDVPFAIVDKTSGKITVANKEALDFEDPSILDHKFEFEVQVTDGEFPKTTLVTITLSDDYEPPHIIPECEGDKCVEICKDNNCEVCSGESCHEICVENCDIPRDPKKVLTVTVKENSPTGYEIMNYAVSDEDLLGNHTKLEVTFSNTNNSDAKSLFVAEMKKVSGEWRLIVSVKDSSKLDYEKIKETHELTIYVNDPDDPAGMYDSLLRVIKVVDVNEAPVITGVTDFNKDIKDADKAKFTFYPKETVKNDEAIGIVVATDPDTLHKDEFARLEYSIVDTTGIPFTMDDSLIIVKDESRINYESAKTEYKFDVQVVNCEWEKSGGKFVKTDRCLDPVIKTVTVNIQDVNETPIIIVDGPIPDGGDDSDSLCVAHCDTTGRGVWKDSILTVGVKENTDDSLLSKTGKILFTYHYVDEDTAHVANAKVTWFDVPSTNSKLTTKGSDLFKLDYNNGTFTVSVKDEKLLDYEKLRNATSRNDPDPEYTVGIVVTDPGKLADTLYRTIRIIDVNEKPLYTAEPCVVVEGNHPGDSIGHVEHPSDIDSLSRNPALYDNDFKMTGGDTDRFELRKDSTDLMRVMLAALDSIDCENGSYVCGVDSVYWVVLTYGDTSLKTIYNNVRIPVKVLDLNEPPEFRTDTIGVAENSPKGTDVGIIEWFDWDRFDTTMHFEITNDPSGCFEINAKTGAVTVKKSNCTALDYEKNPTLPIEVSITDLVDVTDRSLISGGPNTVKKTIVVNVHDVNEPPSITDKTITVKEDTKPKTVVDTVRATDPDNNPEYRDLTYTLIGGDTATFKIEPKTGALILKDTLDYEAKNKYYVTVRVDDGEFADTAKVTINIGNIKEWTKVKITEAETKRKDWENPDVIYINEPINKLCWVQDGDSLCKEDLKIAKDTTIIISWKNPTKDYSGSDTLRVYYSNSIPSVTVTGKKTLVDADNVFTIVEDMGEADTNIYINKSRDSIWVKIKDSASKLDTAIGIEVSLGPIESTKIQGSLDKMTKIVDSKIMRDETAKNVVETAVNSNQYKYTYNEIVGKDTVKVSYMTDKDGEPIKVAVINEKGKVDSVEVITVTYTTYIDGKKVDVSYQADALTGEVFVKGPAGELMEQGASKKIYGSKNSKSGNGVTEGMFTVTTGGKDILGNDRVISYAVDKDGKMVKNTEGDVGYSVTYSYMNKYGNVATESVFIVVDQVGPKVEIISPVNKEVVRSNSVKVVWTVDGVEQDTLNLQGLSKGPNVIVRFYRDKAGNEDSAVVYVYMKDSKDVDISIEQPVTEISKDKIEEYYAVNPPEKGETFAVSIRNPTTGDEVETLIGGSFKTKEGSGKEPYPGVSGSSKHLGPTLALDIKVPVIDGVAGLATLDDLITSDGLIALERTDAKKAHKITVDEYVKEFCEDGFKVPSDVSQVNLFDTKLKAQIWVYTSLGNFVDYFSFTQELNDPSYTDEAGLLKMYFEMKPDKDGFVKADNGKQYATGAFVYKVQATILSKARCTIPDNTYNPDNKKNCNAKERDCDGYGETTKRKGDNIKNSDELLKSFGYRRPKHK